MPPSSHTSGRTQVAPSLDSLFYARLYYHQNFHAVLREALLVCYAAATHYALSLLYRPPIDHHEIRTASLLSTTPSVWAGTTFFPAVLTDVRKIAHAGHCTSAVQVAQRCLRLESEPPYYQNWPLQCHPWRRAGLCPPSMRPPFLENRDSHADAGSARLIMFPPHGCGARCSNRNLRHVVALLLHQVVPFLVMSGPGSIRGSTLMWMIVSIVRARSVLA